MSKRKLLLADDSETVQKVVNLTFELEGIEVITFGDGDSAMEQFSAVVPDVVLADVNMPGMSGYDICQKIKENEATKQTPVILLVGSFEPFDEEKAMQVGADDYLTKPFQSIRQLVSKVNELLTTKKSDSGDELNFDETLKMEKTPYSESDFGDPGMDDEMIQTNQVGNQELDETAKYQTNPENEQEDISKTQPLSERDWQDIYSTQQNPDDSAQTVYELPDEQMPLQEEETNETPEYVSEEGRFEDPVEQTPAETDYESSEERIYVDTSSENVEDFDVEEQSAEAETEEEFGLQPDDIDHFYKEPDYDEEEEKETAERQNFTDESESSQFPEQISEDTDEFEENEESVSYQSDTVEVIELPDSFSEANNLETESIEEREIQTEQSQMSSPVPVINFDEFDLLEIPFPELQTSNTSQETLEIEDRETEPSDQQPAITESETDEVKTEVAQQLSGVNLSPEDIDAIAEKVVEKLSARLKE